MTKLTVAFRNFANAPKNNFFTEDLFTKYQHNRYVIWSYVPERVLVAIVIAMFDFNVRTEVL
jgi:hypothetical protein